MAIVAARPAADDAIIMTYINIQRSASKYTITACRAKVKFTWRMYALSERLLVSFLSSSSHEIHDKYLNK